MYSKNKILYVLKNVIKDMYYNRKFSIRKTHIEVNLHIFMIL